MVWLSMPGSLQAVQDHGDCRGRIDRGHFRRMWFGVRAASRYRIARNSLSAHISTGGGPAWGRIRRTSGRDSVILRTRTKLGNI